MYVIKRNKSMWLCSSARSAFEVNAVQIRLQGEMKDFDKFKQKLDSYECLGAGVISISKCSDAVNCSECPKYVGCEILKNAQETIQAQSEFAKWVEANDGYMLL